MNTADRDIELEIETVRPTMSLVKDVFGGRTSEVWIFNNCAVAEMKDDTFCALIVRRFTGGPYKGETYFGFIPSLRLKNTKWATRDMLEDACGMFADCPAVFYTEPTWENVKEGRRYV